MKAVFNLLLSKSRTQIPHYQNTFSSDGLVLNTRSAPGSGADTILSVEKVCQKEPKVISQVTSMQFLRFFMFVPPSMDYNITTDPL